MLSSLRGFKDVLSDEALKWQWVETVTHEVFSAFGFSPIQVPLLEDVRLFHASVGATSDIVEKQMYAFDDLDGKRIGLRPEATASVMRAYIEHNLHTGPVPTKLYYSGPMFRHERPQAGRLRQFHQMGAEVIGVLKPHHDVELLSLLAYLFERLTIRGIVLQINSIGCPVCRPLYRNELLAFLQGYLSKLCENCRRRSRENPLRVLDCKEASCRGIASASPSPLDHLCAECAHHFRAVQEGLSRLNIPFLIQPRLVRGLDYYTKTVFEATSEHLGAQSAVAAGGRYDGLAEALGGAPTPALGFAIGMERLMALLDPTQVPERPLQLFLIPLGSAASKMLSPILYALRKRGMRCEMGDEEASLKSQMKRGDRLSAQYVLIVGNAEIEAGVAQIRNMQNKVQQGCALTDLTNNLLAVLNA